jgi:uncharacterized protein YbjT (DUF2867 family)
MDKKKFLIIGGIGSTGSKVIDFLIEHGHKVRAFVRKEDARIPALKNK